MKLRRWEVIKGRASQPRNLSTSQFLILLNVTILKYLKIFKEVDAMHNKDHRLSRRDFLKHTAIGVVGAGIGISGFRNLQVAIGADGQLPSFDKSRVIAVKNNGIMKSGSPDQKIVQKMMDEGMFALTGKKQLPLHGVRFYA